MGTGAGAGAGALAVRFGLLALAIFASVSIILAGTAGGAGFGRPLLTGVSTFGGGLPGGVVESSTQEIRSEKKETARGWHGTEDDRLIVAVPWERAGERGRIIL